MKKVDYWILRDRKPIPATLSEWSSFWSDIDLRRVANSTVGRKCDVRISTVFLGTDHSWDPKQPPILFETMIFGGPLHDYCERYSTWEEAELGHERAVKLARGAHRSPWLRIRAWIEARGLRNGTRPSPNPPPFTHHERRALPFGHAFLDGFGLGLIVGAIVGALLFGGLLEVVCNASNLVWRNP
jgi:hypothetical protein